MPGFVVIFSVLSPMTIDSLYRQPLQRHANKLTVCFATRGTNPQVCGFLPLDAELPLFDNEKGYT